MNTLTLKNSLFFSVIYLSLIACSGGNSSDETSTNLKSTTLSSTNAITNTTWAYCGAGIKFRYHFQENQYAYTLQYFQDDQCITPDEDPELGNEFEFFSGDEYSPESITWTGTIELGQNTITTGGGLEATEVDFNYKGITKYDIISIQNNTLYFGINGGAFSEINRENELDFDDAWLNEGACCQN